MLRSRRLGRSAGLLGLVVVVLTGCGGGGSGGGHTRSAQPALGPGPAPPSAGRTRAPVRPQRGGRRDLAGRLDHELTLAGPNSGAYVYDLSTGRPVFGKRSGVGRPPASVEKLFTSVALLERMGPGARLQTRVLGSGSLGPAGVWHGNLYLVGGGDPTLSSAAFRQIYQGGYGPTLTDLAARLRADGIRRVTGSLIGDATRYSSERGGPTTKYGPDLADLGGELSALAYNHGASGGIAKGAVTPGAYATEQLALALHAVGIQVVPATATGRAPSRARVLAGVDSPPLSSVLRLMNVPSDDFYAEMLTEELGARFGGAGNIPTGTGVISDAVANFGVHPQIADGSGLSRDDRASPRQVVTLLKLIAGDQPRGRVLNASLPVVGVNGTTRRIAQHTVAQGRCVAKTGTLAYVTNLAGYCSAAHHQELAFAFFVDGPPNPAALEIEGRMVADIVRLDADRP